ncbi:facilitated trehalose transporter Tret1-like [Cochliomyia hominivorax]
MSSNDHPQIKQNKRSILNKKYRHQLLAVITVELVAFGHGISIGWTSPTLHKLQSEDTPLNFTVTIEQISWIGSLFGLGSLMGNILFGFLLNRIGRKWCMNLIVLPYLISWFLIFLSKTYLYLYIARFLSGITGGGFFVVAPIFISEISDPSIRGALSSMAMLLISFGILAGFILSSHLSYYINPCLYIMLPILYLLAATRFPETPQYLIRKNKIVKAHEAFKYYKNLTENNVEAHKDEKEALKEDGEFLELKENILKIINHSEKLTINDFITSSALKAFLTAFVVMALCQFSGTLAFLYYMSDMFARVGTDIHPNTCTIIMGVAQLMGTYLTVILVDRFGRKLLMLVSSAGMAVGLIGFGLFIELTSSEVRIKYNWLPVVIMTFVVLMANIAVTFLIIIETFPLKIRAAGTTICSSLMSCMIFVVLKIFPLLLYNYGLAMVLFSSGGVCVLGLLYILMCLQETKGISMDQ